MSIAVCTCGWIAFEVNRSHAEEEVTRFNAYYDKLSPDLQESCYGNKRSYIEIYEYCVFCNGSYKKFLAPTKEDEARAFGHTLNPIIKKDE